MNIPKFLKDNDTIGITACSCGVLDKIDKYEKSINNIKKYNLNIKETNNVRTSGKVSSDINTRVKELDSLVTDKNINMISIAAGGDFMFDMLDNINYENIKNNLKWFSGSSDPTSLLYTITTNLDIPTIYSPSNMSGFDSENLHQSYIDYLNIIKGNLVKQYKSEYYESDDNVYDLPNKWLNLNGNVNVEGALIGGCLDVLKDLIGTKFDKTKEFISKYDNIIWYFDIFSLSSEELYRTLLQFKYAGYFENTKLIIIGKVRFPNTITNTSYEDAIKESLGNIKVIYNFDIGHVKPSMTMINGFEVRVISNEKEGSLEYIK